MCKRFNLRIANGRTPGDSLGNYTCYTHNGASVVDLIIADSDFFTQIKKLYILPPEFMSAHTPLSVSINCTPKMTQKKCDKLNDPPPKLIWDSSKNEELLEIFKSDEVNSQLDDLQLCLSGSHVIPKSIDETVQNFCNILVTNASKCLKLVKTKKSPPSPAKTKPKGKSWYDSSCYAVKKRLRIFAKLLAKQPTNPHTRGHFIQAKKEYRRMLKSKKRDFERSAINNLLKLSSNPKDFWAYTKKLRSMDSNTITNSIAVSPGIWVDHFTSVNKRDPSSLHPNDPYIVHVLKELIDISKQQHPKCKVLDKPFTIKEILGAIKRLKLHKASGIDIVSNDLIKATADIISPLLCSLFNSILSTEYFPKQWCIGMIIPLYKSGEFDDPNNYRGISINSCISKLFTLILNDRFTEYLNVNNTIYYNQIGFRKGYRPADHVFTLKTLVDQAFHAKKDLYVCFVDFRKAYDTVWRDGLFYKLLKQNISPKFVNILKSMYSSLKSCVQVPAGFSTFFPSLVGLKQGCNLSPMLFNFFINDFAENLDPILCDAPSLHNLGVNCLLYADDMVLISESKEGLQKSLDMLYTFTQSWFL